MTLEQLAKQIDKLIKAGKINNKYYPDEYNDDNEDEFNRRLVVEYDLDKRLPVLDEFDYEGGECDFLADFASSFVAKTADYWNDEYIAEEDWNEEIAEETGYDSWEDWMEAFYSECDYDDRDVIELDEIYTSTGIYYQWSTKSYKKAIKFAKDIVKEQQDGKLQ